MQPTLTSAMRLTLEALYVVLLLLHERVASDPAERAVLGPAYETVVLSGIVQLAQLLDRPCPVQTRTERRHARLDVVH